MRANGKKLEACLVCVDLFWFSLVLGLFCFVLSIAKMLSEMKKKKRKKEKILITTNIAAEAAGSQSII